MIRHWRQIVERYGQSVTLYPRGHREGVRHLVFLQPVQEQGQTFFQNLPTPLGPVRQDRWICMGGPELALDRLGDGYLEWNGQRFSVRSAQPVYIGDTLVYWWGLLAVRDEAPGD